MRILNLLFLLAPVMLRAQDTLSPDTAFQKELLRTGLLHRPITVNKNASFDNQLLQATKLKEKALPAFQMASNWLHKGHGQLSAGTAFMKSGSSNIRLAHPLETENRARGSASDADYAVYGSSSIQYKLNNENWSAFNALEFFIFPVSPGARVVNINLRIKGSTASIDHLIPLENGVWNQCRFSLQDLPREQVEQIEFAVTLKGKDRTSGDSAVYYIDAFSLLELQDLAPTVGWMPSARTIVYSYSGYTTKSKKTALIAGDAFANSNVFELRNPESGKSVFRAPIKRLQNAQGAFGELDFSAFRTRGSYTLCIGKTCTSAFPIDEDIWINSEWKALHFIFCQRCGYPVPGVHGNCHADLFAKHQEKTISFAGGWHDAGDLSQQTLQTADVSVALLEGYDRHKQSNPALAARMLEEAEWGLEFVLKTRFGDGYRASSMGLLIWLDGILGTKDDIYSVRVQDNSFDNFLYAAYEAYAAKVLEADTAFADYLRRVAISDYAFALAKFHKEGFPSFIHFYEHSYNTSESQYYATMSWAASQLFMLTKEQQYADQAAEFIQYTISCQQKTDIGEDLSGFFYRNTSKKSVVHYVHQSREQVYMQALVALCESQPSHADRLIWQNAIGLYAGYLKRIQQCTAPYGMAPGGVYHELEALDSAAFYSLHLFPPENAQELYGEQVKKGVALGNGFYLKRFPVWFSIFNGNEVVLLSVGKAAAVAGNYLRDSVLLDIAHEQLYWTVGKNPFAQSLMYGEGRNFSYLDNFSSGQIAGALPVGIRSYKNEDIPYWPMANHATYKEVWVTCAGKWISLLAELK